MRSLSMGFSVLMSVYAKESPERLSLALESLKNQTLCADEVVLVEDGPITDELDRVIGQYRNALTIVSVRLTTNVGLAAALNAGLQVCRYPLVARMDTDDVAMPQRFEVQMGFWAKNKSVDVFGSWAVDVDTGHNALRVREVPLTHDEIVRLIWTCPFIHPTVMYRREAILELGGYSVDAHRSEDYELWIRAAKAGLRFANLAEALVHYSVRPMTSWGAS